MKLKDFQVDAVQSQMNVAAVPEDDGAVVKLTELFGEHTFLVNEEGVFIFEQKGPKNGHELPALMFAVALKSDDESDEFIVQSPPVELDIKMKVDTGELYQEQ